MKEQKKRYDHWHEIQAHGEAPVGFADPRSGQYIVNPYRDSTGGVRVDPRPAYGFREDADQGGRRLTLTDEDGLTIHLTDHEGASLPECSHEWKMGAVDPDGRLHWIIDHEPGGAVEVRWYPDAIEAANLPIPSEKERSRILIVNGLPVTLGDLFDANEAGFSPNDRRRILALKRGRGTTIGGGAAAEAHILRPASGPEPLTEDQWRAVQKALEGMSPHPEEWDIDWIKSGSGASLRDGALVCWYSPENEEDPITLWYHEDHGYLTPSEYYETFEAER